MFFRDPDMVLIPQNQRFGFIMNAGKTDFEMRKAYWISTYQKVIDETKLAAYAALAGPAISAGGGRFLARGTPAKAYEAGLLERTVLIEFDSLETAIATHDGAAYGAALDALDGGAVREIRIIEAAE
jgi:uncharacterized protein (DUF1330 family)